MFVVSLHSLLRKHKKQIETRSRFKDSANSCGGCESGKTALRYCEGIWLRGLAVVSERSSLTLRIDKKISQRERIRLQIEEVFLREDRIERYSGKIIEYTFGYTVRTLLWRVWSWLRMNASGRLNTCKSSGILLREMRAAHGWVTRT